MGERLRACREAHRPHRPPLRLSLQALQIHFWGAHAKYTEFETAVLAALAAEGSGACLCAKGGGATEEGRERARALGRAGGGGGLLHTTPRASLRSVPGVVIRREADTGARDLHAEEVRPMRSVLRARQAGQAAEEKQRQSGRAA